MPSEIYILVCVSTNYKYNIVKMSPEVIDQF